MGDGEATCLGCDRAVVGKLRRGCCESCYRSLVRQLKKEGRFVPAARPGDYEQISGHRAGTRPKGATHPGLLILRRVKRLPNGCWQYTGRLDGQGYGRFDRSRVHRAVWQVLVGEIPAGAELDHLCHTRDASCEGGTQCLHRRCVNPDHLEPVSGPVNNARSNSPSAINARKTHCNRGHEFTPENTYWASPKKPHLRRTRRCRTCARHYQARYSS